MNVRRVSCCRRVRRSTSSAMPFAAWRQMLSRPPKTDPTAGPQTGSDGGGAAVFRVPLTVEASRLIDDEVVMAIWNNDQEKLRAFVDEKLSERRRGRSGRQ